MYCKYSIDDTEELLSFPDDISHIRLDKLLRILLESKGISREKIQRYIEEGYVSVNNIVCTQRAKKISPHDTLAIHIPTEQSLLTQEEGDIDVVYEDPSFLVLNKPASLVVHPCVSTPQNTLLQRVLFHYPELLQMGGERPAIVHRLDKDTTGLLLLARTEHARYTFIQAFSERSIVKHYLAFVEGNTPEHGIIEYPIGRDPVRKTRMSVTSHGKYAYTEYTKLATFPQGTLPYPVSFLYIRIATGRTHQIRVHCSHIGFPLLGDTLYGAKSSFVQRPLLHAFTLQFAHPCTHKPLFFSCIPPSDFEQTYLALSMQSIRVILTGSAGSGKSTVLQYYQDVGIPCCSADAIIDELYQKGNSLWYYCKQSYGNRFFNDNEEIDKIKILDAMRQSPHYKQEIERIAHSFLIEAVHTFWKEHATAQYTVVEIPLYFESTLFQKECPADIVITVYSPPEERIKRMKKKQWSDEKIQYIIANQYDDEYKKAHADYVIYNTSTYTMLTTAIEQSLSYINEYYTQHIATIQEQYQQLLSPYLTDYPH